jgi:hypothetical protein
MPLPETRLTVEARPRAGRDEIVGWQGTRLRVRVTAPPAGGAANRAVCALLAEGLGVAPSRVEIVRGHTSRTKIVRIVGVTPDEAARRLAPPGTPGPTGAAARSA